MPSTILPPSFDSPPPVLLRRWKHVRTLADAFWKRWVHEYLATLQVRQKWLSPQRSFEKGDLVLIVETTPRDQWPLARVLKTFPDDGGVVRRVLVKARGREFDRHVSRLVLLEAADGNGDPAIDGKHPHESTTETYVANELLKSDRRV